MPEQMLFDIMNEPLKSNAPDGSGVENGKGKTYVFRAPRTNLRPMLLSEEELDEVRGFVASARWNKARTYAATNPHEYALNPKKFRRDDRVYKLFLVAIQHCGYGRQFFRSTVRYFDLDGFTYWGGYPDNRDCDLINRVPCDGDPYPL